MEFGNFLNPFVEDPRMFWPVAIGVVVALGLFGYFYNRKIDGMKDEVVYGKTSFLVAGGMLFTVAMVAILSWKAALLCLAALTIDGVFMIVGDVSRSIAKLEKETKSRKRKPLPYAAAGLIDDALMVLADSQRSVKSMLKGNVDVQKIGLVGIQITEAVQKLTEARKVEGE